MAQCGQEMGSMVGGLSKHISVSSLVGTSFPASGGWCYGDMRGCNECRGVGLELEVSV